MKMYVVYLCCFLVAQAWEINLVEKAGTGLPAEIRGVTTPQCIFLNRVQILVAMISAQEGLSLRMKAIPFIRLENKPEFQRH